MKLEDLEKELKQEKLAPLYLLYGEERFLLENCLKKIKKKNFWRNFKRNKLYRN